MNNLRVAIRIAFAMFLFACAMGLATILYANDKPKIVPPPATVVVTERHHDYSAALVGAGITWWLMRRRARRERPEPIAVVPPQPVCPTTDERLERVLELCGK